jgi:eukaryotic-like serine/threonine-protein kinase
MDPNPQQGPTDVIIGQTIGNYLVTQKLGEGGMGSVYLAEHPGIGKKVAIKVLHAEFSSNRGVTERFFTEAKAVNDIGHPNIVDIVDYGIIQAGAGRDQLVYFIMEFLGGMSLSKLIQTESPLSPERAFGIAMQVADALAASHRCNIVHRDLKPDNIMLVQRGRERDFVKLLDFGIAKLTGNTTGSQRTQTGVIMGTPAYMSPEQCDGRGQIDARTDVYALGIVLYEMLVGRVPFVGEGYGEVLVQHLTQQAVPPSQYRMLNPHVEAVIMKALEKRPELRYPTMDEMIRAMSDPVGYVEANGGIPGFSQRQLMPSTAPLPPVSRPTPPPLTGPMTAPMPTPVPGAGYTPTPTPGAYMVPTTLGGAAGEVQQGRSKTGFVIAGAVVVVAAVIGVVLATRGPSNAASEDESSAAGSDETGSDEGSAPVAVVDAAVTPPPADAAEQVVAIDAAPVIEAPKVATVTVTTSPPGADILVNGVEIGVRTPDPFELPIADKPVTLLLRLEGHKDIVYKIVPNQNISHEKTFTKKRTPTIVRPGSGSGSAKTPGTGSNRPGNDTGLIRPGD